MRRFKLTLMLESLIFNFANLVGTPFIGIIFALIIRGRAYIIDKLCGKIESIYFWIVPCLTAAQIWLFKIENTFEFFFITCCIALNFSFKLVFESENEKDKFKK